MLIKEIKQALIGKVLSYYDGWNGSSDYFKIGYIKECGSCISVYPKKGKGFGVIIPKAYIPKLIECGECVRHNEVERCSFETRWALF